MLFKTNLLPDIQVCVSIKTGTWGILVGDQFKAVDSIKSSTSLLPLLEIEYNDFQDQLGKIVRELDLSMDSFPYKLLLINALSYPTSYWPELAISWLENSEFTDEEILQALYVIINNKSYGQHLRQRSKKIIKKYKKS